MIRGMGSKQSYFLNFNKGQNMNTYYTRLNGKLLKHTCKLNAENYYAAHKNCTLIEVLPNGQFLEISNFGVLLK